MEIIATRIYFLLLARALIILLLYTVIEIQKQTITIDNPSVSAFEQLQSNLQASPTLECPCQNIDIPYNMFISISPRLHQLCSSDFITKRSLWMSLIYFRTAGLDYPYDDFRVFAIAQFQLMVSLCTIANETLSNALSLFNANILVHNQVQSREATETHASTSLRQFRLSIPRTFMRTLDSIRYINQDNGIVSSTQSNCHFFR